ncbi:MAG: hypothetical protein KC561_02705, partial [Myxococcales bacterium]|nr:hypothetical protein [Myxococcales bacterium]
MTRTSTTRIVSTGVAALLGLLGFAASTQAGTADFDIQGSGIAPDSMVLSLADGWFDFDTSSINARAFFDP